MREILQGGGAAPVCGIMEKDATGFAGLFPGGRSNTPVSREYFKDVARSLAVTGRSGFRPFARPRRLRCHGVTPRRFPLAPMEFRGAGTTTGKGTSAPCRARASRGLCQN